MQEKMQKKLIVKKNISKVIEIKGISKYEFYKITGITRGILDQNNGISEENITRFLAYFTDIDANWLITGIGEMYRNNGENSSNLSDENTTNDNTSRLITILQDALKEKDKQIDRLLAIIEQRKGLV